ncbi:MAG TPA: hypothetical protein QGG18_09455, partial [Rhodospirillales bacterium]|nr:hypothetical protein [Rhodospirillales bacterium]
MMEDQVQEAWKWLRDNAAPVTVIGLIIAGVWAVYIRRNPPKSSEVGITLEQYTEALKRREKEVTKWLETVHDAERQVLLKEKDGIEAKLLNTETAYER